MNEDSAPEAEAEVPLPPVFVKNVSAEELGALFNDIGACALVDEVRLKSLAEGHADEQTGTDLNGALSAILEGRAQGVQLRYRYREEAWWDTVLVEGSGFRVVRIQAPKLD